MKTIYLFIFLLIILSDKISFAQSGKLSEPERNFETFWNFFNDNYAFFTEKGIDWKKVYEQNRYKIDSTTTEKALIDIFIQMVDPLKDGHVYILRKRDFLYGWQRTSIFETEYSNDSLVNQFWLNSNRTLIQNGFDSIVGVGHKIKNENVLYYSQSKDYGYLRISRFFVHEENLFDGGDVVDVPELLGLVDSIMHNFLIDKKGLIIDIRNNGGGHGGKELASRFITKKTPICLKTERINGKYSNLDTISIEPTKGYSFNRPIMVLTNDETASSAEAFSLGMSSMYNVKLIGINTEGIFSSTYDKELTNGLWFTLSNKKYYTLNHELLEGIGVNVDYKVYNRREDLTKGIDNVVIKAIELLKMKN